MGDAFERFFLAVIIISITLGGLTVWAAPKIWLMVKPWLHAVTA